MFGRKKKPKPVHVYSYVGEHVWTAADEDETAAETRKQIATTEDIAGWVKDHHEEAEFNGLVPASFIIDRKYNLWIASRYSEHVACACGNDVLTAGEIFFGEEGGGPSVDRITNQSTGYCPEPSSWDIVDFVEADTEEALAAFSNLLLAIEQAHGKQAASNIQGHEEIAVPFGTRKRDPGPLFPWVRFYRSAGRRTLGSPRPCCPVSGA